MTEKFKPSEKTCGELYEEAVQKTIDEQLDWIEIYGVDTEQFKPSDKN